MSNSHWDEHDSVQSPWNDQRWSARVEPEQLPRRETLGATPEAEAAGILDLLAAEFDDHTFPIGGFARWLSDADIECEMSMQFFEN
ncbi:hypothetical protein [Mycobacterium sp. URHB0021]